MVTNNAFKDLLPVAERPLTIGEMVVDNYRKAEVFRKYGLDYCCGGKRSLEEVCQKKGLDAKVVQQELEVMDLVADDSGNDYNNWPLDKLSEHIVTTHHQYVVGALPMLYELTAKVARVHGDKHPELLKIAQHFNAVAQELEMHMQKEEGMLFPYITKMAQAQRNGSAMPIPVFGTIENPIRMMDAEHESAGGGMESIAELSDNYTPPLDACTSYRVLFAKLSEFEQDLHQHVHLESNILFPKSIMMEKGTLVA